MTAARNAILFVYVCVSLCVCADSCWAALQALCPAFIV